MIVISSNPLQIGFAVGFALEIPFLPAVAIHSVPHHASEEGPPAPLMWR